MKLYRLYRQKDESGVSGVGLVAEAIEFSSGRVAVSFFPGLANVSSVTVYDSLADAEAIHGHGGLTRFVPVSVAEYSEGRVRQVAA